MSEAKHTTGPWALDFGPDVDLVNHVGISAKKHGLLAQVVWKMDDDERSDTCEANARLIAASPDLLDALDTCMGTLEICFPEAPVDSVIGKNIVAARAAIAKATGGAAC